MADALQHLGRTLPLAGRHSGRDLRLRIGDFSRETPTPGKFLVVLERGGQRRGSYNIKNYHCVLSGIVSTFLV
jgi:hypothetical protein